MCAILSSPVFWSVCGALLVFGGTQWFASHRDNVKLRTQKLDELFLSLRSLANEAVVPDASSYGS